MKLFLHRVGVAAGLIFLSACGGGGGGGGNSAAVATSPAEGYGEPNNDQIRPGVQISSEHGGCTTNFVYIVNEVTLYIGTAAHCFSSQDSAGSSPCTGQTERPGYNNIVIENASRAGTLVYSSWDAMQARNEIPGSTVCDSNDFALVQIHADDLSRVHPSAVAFGGPTGLHTEQAAVGDRVLSYGQSDFHGGVEDLETREGRISSVSEWIYRVSSENPGTPGDSGSAVLHEDGRALGVLSTLGVGNIAQPTAPVTNGVVNLRRALDYAKAGGFIPASTRVETSDDFSAP